MSTSITINDVVELIDHIDSIEHRHVDCETFIAVKTKIIIGGYEFTTSDKVYKPATGLARSQARNTTELLDIIAIKIRDRELIKIHKIDVEVGEELAKEAEGE